MNGCWEKCFRIFCYWQTDRQTERTTNRQTHKAKTVCPLLLQSRGIKKMIIHSFVQCSSFLTHLDSSKSASWYSISNTCPSTAITTPGSIFSCSKSKLCLEVGVIGYKCKKLAIIKVIASMNRYMYINAHIFIKSILHNVNEYSLAKKWYAGLIDFCYRIFSDNPPLNYVAQVSPFPTMNIQVNMCT